MHVSDATLGARMRAQTLRSQAPVWSGPLASLTILRGCQRSMGWRRRRRRCRRCVRMLRPSALHAGRGKRGVHARGRPPTSSFIPGIRAHASTQGAHAVHAGAGGPTLCLPTPSGPPPPPRPQPDGPGATYGKKLTELAKSDPQAFICHYYNFYFAHTAGGRMIGNKVRGRQHDWERRVWTAAWPGTRRVGGGLCYSHARGGSAWRVHTCPASPSLLLLWSLRRDSCKGTGVILHPVISRGLACIRASATQWKCVSGCV